MGEHAPNTVFLVGTGAAGTALGLWLSRRGHVLAGAWNRSVRGARAAQESLPIPVSAQGTPELPNCDLVLVAVSDGAIPEVGAMLRAQMRPGMVVAHVSGALPAAALGEQPVPRGSLHPLVAIRSPRVAADALNRALLTLEGDPAAIEFLETLVAGTGARVQRLESAAKARYHAAAVMAANLAVALVTEAAEIARAAGVRDAERALAELAAVAIDNVIRHGAAQGLTGPVSRGDVDVVRRHLAELEGPTRTIYRTLSGRALRLAEARGLDPDAARALARVLHDGE